VDTNTVDGSSGGEVDVYGRPSFAAFEAKPSLLSGGGGGAGGGAPNQPGATYSPIAAAAAASASASASRGSVFESALPVDLAWRYQQLGALLPQAPLPLATLQRVWKYGDGADAADAAQIFEMQVGRRRAGRGCLLLELGVGGWCGLWGLKVVECTSFTLSLSFCHYMSTKQPKPKRNQHQQQRVSSSPRCSKTAPSG